MSLCPSSPRLRIYLKCFIVDILGLDVKSQKISIIPDVTGQKDTPLHVSCPFSDCFESSFLAPAFEGLVTHAKHML